MGGGGAVAVVGGTVGDSVGVVVAGNGVGVAVARGVEVGEGGVGITMGAGVAVAVACGGKLTTVGAGKLLAIANQARLPQTKIQITRPNIKAPTRPAGPYRTVSRVMGPAGW